MKKIYMNQFLLAGTLTGCLLLASCDQEQEFTTGMPEQQLINSIELEVTSNCLWLLAWTPRLCIRLCRRMSLIKKYCGFLLTRKWPLFLKMVQSRTCRG